jgi:hypothetical protein
MECVSFPCAICQLNRIEPDIFEVLQTQSAGHFGIEAAGAKLPVTLLKRAEIHDIIDR